MTKTAIKNELLTWTEGRPFISISDLAKVLKIGRDSARNQVKGLGYIKHGRRKDYLIEDIAKRLAEEICE